MTWPEIIQGVIGIIVTIGGYFVVAYFRTKTAAIKDEQAKALAEAAVNAVEQTLKAAESKTKFDTAEINLREMLKAKGITLDDTAIKTFIESEVKKMNDVAKLTE